MALGSSGKPLRIAFLLVPRFSMMAFAAAVEPLRAANRLSGSPLFEWQLVSADGNPVTASNGISVAAQGSLAELRVTAHADSDESLEDIFLRLTGGEEDQVLARALAAT